jgi:hypothetical protein
MLGCKSGTDLRNLWEVFYTGQQVSTIVDTFGKQIIKKFNFSKKLNFSKSGNYHETRNI